MPSTTSCSGERRASSRATSAGSSSPYSEPNICATNGPNPSPRSSGAAGATWACMRAERERLVHVHHAAHRVVVGVGGRDHAAHRVPDDQRGLAVGADLVDHGAHVGGEGRQVVGRGAG